MKQLLQHLEFDQLVRRVEVDLSENELQQTDKHLASCAKCQSDLIKLENFFAFAKSANTETVPQAVTANLLNIYQPSKPQSKATLREHLRGILTFDDWLPEFAVHERLAFSDTRQMLFRAEHFEIDLRLNFAGNKCQISGQIFPDCTSGEVEISSENFSEKVSLNEYCEFVLPFVSEGIYDFKIILKDTQIKIPQVSLFS